MYLETVIFYGAAPHPLLPAPPASSYASHQPLFTINSSCFSFSFPFSEVESDSPQRWRTYLDAMIKNIDVRKNKNVSHRKDEEQCISAQGRRSTNNVSHVIGCKTTNLAVRKKYDVSRCDDDKHYTCHKYEDRYISMQGRKTTYPAIGKKNDVSRLNLYIY